MARDTRDVVMAWSDDGGQTWTSPKRVSDGPPLFNDVLPAVHVDERGWVHVAWYDFREDMHCGARENVYWRMSHDGGGSFLPSKRIGEYTGLWQGYPPIQHSPVGERLALTSQGTMLHLAWGDQRDRETGPTEVWTEIYTGRVNLDAVVATRVALFEVSASGDGVQVRWRLNSVSDLASLELQRANESEAPFEPLALTLTLPAEGDEQVVTDASATPGQSYRYRLRLIGRDGGSSYSEERSVALPVRVAGLAWQRAEPNPFSRFVNVRLASGTSRPVEVSIHDLRGARVRMLRRGELAAGETSVQWDGRREDGQRVAPGVYVVRATDGTTASTMRIVKVD